VPLHVEQARTLIRVGALRFTGKSKPGLALGPHPDASGTMRTHRTDGDLFITKVEEPKLPELKHYPLADAYDELELLGFPLARSVHLGRVKCPLLRNRFPMVGRDGTFDGQGDRQVTPLRAPVPSTHWVDKQ
jgi:hypothetical protein